MSYKLTWMPDVLLDAGLKVAECEGWRERGRSEMGTVRGVMVHHTGNPKPGNMPTLEVLKRGRMDLRGPLANLGLGRDGTYYVVAAGRANHAGVGQYRQVKTGNSSFIGIEAEHSGDPSEQWPEAQRDAFARGVAALLNYLNASLDMCIAHKEWALPKGRKVDPCFDMPEFRTLISDYMLGRTPPPPVPVGDQEGRPTLRRGSEGELVEELQERLDVRSDGVFGPKTEAALRKWQRANELTADGICGPKTWGKLSSTEVVRSDPQDEPSSAGAMRLGQSGLDLLHDFEGCARRLPDGRYAAYPDPGSKSGRPWTIGWGSTGRDISEGTVWTQQECDDRFKERIKRYVSEVNQALGGAPTSQAQFDALVSFHYNTGRIASATLTRLHRAGDYRGAAHEFARWVRNDGKIMSGLIRRRQAEADLYSSEMP